jgi:galactokinase/mevalonate kinase-like predicted kinase
VNVALDLAVEASLVRRREGYAVSQGAEQVEAPDAAALRARPSTALLGVIAEAGELPPCALQLRSGSPRGAGLGASSALAVAVLAAGELATAGALVRSAAERAAVARDVEARLMSLPTGKQDHYPGQLGGALEIEHAPGGERVRRLAVDLVALGERLVVAYTGQSHFSAGANWQVVRRRLDGEPRTVERFDAIRDAALRLPAALESGEWESAGRLVGAEWRARRGLSEEISTPRIEALLALAERAGAWGGKAGGAGGGGSVFVLAPPERRAAIESAWRAAGATLLATRPTPRALEFELAS